MSLERQNKGKRRRLILMLLMYSPSHLQSIIHHSIFIGFTWMCDKSALLKKKEDIKLFLAKVLVNIIHCLC